jgi:DNA-binding response OmpR family regulator
LIPSPSSLHVNRILIIDDDPELLLTARMFLEQAGYQVTVLSDPEKIVARIRENRYDLVLLDMNFRRGNTEGTEGIQ